MTTITLHNGEGVTFDQFETEPDNNGTLTSDSLYYGHLFVTIDGEEYGSLKFELIDGKPVITLGQYAPAFDQWAPQNPLTDPEEV